MAENRIKLALLAWIQGHSTAKMVTWFVGRHTIFDMVSLIPEQIAAFASSSSIDLSDPSPLQTFSRFARRQSGFYDINIITVELCI